MSYIDEYVNQIIADGDPVLNSEIDDTLRKAAQYFVASLKQGIHKFYASYSPVLYIRTSGLYPTVDFNNIGEVHIKQANATIEITFNEDIRPSVFGQESIDAFWLMNSGYAVSRGWHKNIPYFGYRAGAHYIEDAQKQTELAFADIGLTIKINNPYQ